MLQLFSKLFIGRFYKLNAGFFLVSMIALFGIATGPDTVRMHHSLMRTITGQPLYLSIGLAVFGLYNFKCVSFLLKELGRAENGFLYHMQSVPDRKQFWWLAVTQGALYLPIMMYGLFTAGVGFSDGHYVAAVTVVLWQVAMVGVGGYISFRTLNGTWKRPILRLPTLVLVKNRTYPFYLLYHSLFARKGAIIGIKVFSLVLLQFMVALNADKPSKENICFLMLLCISTHALLPVYYVDFLERELAFLRGLPVSLGRRYGQFVLTYALLFLPELCFLLWNEQGVLPVSVIFSIYALCISRLLLYTSLQYLPGMDTNRYTGVVFVMFFVTLILIASQSLWLFSVAEFLVSVGLFWYLYYRYEQKTYTTG